MRFPFTFLFAVLVLGGRGVPARAQGPGPALTLIGDSGRTRTLTSAELGALPQVEVREVDKDSSRIVFRGPTIRDLMTLVGAPAGHALRGPSMLLVVIAEASDGYKVAYTLSELDEQFGARIAILAFTQNDGPLPASEGPLRVVVAGEQHHARWTRQVVRLRLVRAGS